MPVAKVLAYFVYYLLDLVILAMLLRVVVEFFTMEEGGRLHEFLCMLTEPLVMPLRQLFYKMNWFQQTPLDIAYLAMNMILVLVSFLLRQLL